LNELRKMKFWLWYTEIYIFSKYLFYSWMNLSNIPKNRFSRRRKRRRDHCDSSVIEIFLREVRATLCSSENRFRLWKIFIEDIFITFWNICCALHTRFDGRHVALTTVSATWEIRPLYNEWSSLWEREVQREYHESLCIPHRSDWDTRRIASRATNLINLREQLWQMIRKNYSLFYHLRDKKEYDFIHVFFIFNFHI